MSENATYYGSEKQKKQGDSWTNVLESQFQSKAKEALGVGELEKSRKFLMIGNLLKAGDVETAINTYLASLTASELQLHEEKEALYAKARHLKALEARWGVTEEISGIIEIHHFPSYLDTTSRKVEFTKYVKSLKVNAENSKKALTRLGGPPRS